jgi:hypothetical protein
MIRGVRARALKDLESGEDSIREVLRNPPGYFLGVDIWVLLTTPLGMGTESARKVCERSYIWPHTELGELTNKQRSRIIDELPERIK